ncbi:alanine/glycine:cation symporter family protein [Candidatus Clostridium radicumherbarum]|uniref:Alanine/glycine:cation symporter family protein n=1 Tax=Candidatus Clostridium radicumherbarum TaxID=3381662 RepID=A0ABW8TU12_9CLOT
MESFGKLIAQIDGWLWGLPLIILLFGTHLFLTFRLKFIQRYIGKAIKLSVTKDDFAEGDVSQFSALCTALAATIGTGNIVGVATAVGLGGPGAVLWCWLTGVFGIATKYSEALLSVKYRVKTKDGTMAGGPMYVLEHGLKAKWAGVLFAIFTSIAAFGIGCMVQANSVAAMTYETFKLPTWITGIIIAALTAVVILGGIKKIAKVCDILVPFMAIFYVLGCLILLALGYKTIGSTISLIVSDAFSPQAAVGGFAGAGVMMAMRYGIARGLFSNESGLGSAPIVAAAAQTRNPVKQALVSSTGTFWDTVVVCAMTGLVLVNSGAWQQGLKGAALTKTAFSDIPVIGPIILTVGLLTFVFSTILGWSYYGEKAIEYLLGKKAILPYRILWVIFVFVGSVFSLSLVWDLADLFNGLMAIPNLVALLVLSPIIAKETKKYLWDNNLEEISNEPAIIIKENNKNITM